MNSTFFSFKETKLAHISQKSSPVWCLTFYSLVFVLCPLVLNSCSGSGGQFADMRLQEFGETRITESKKTTITIGNPSTTEEQHLRLVKFDAVSNAAGHFHLDSIMVGDQIVSPQDIVVPPGSILKLQFTYSPLNLETSLANYGGWETGVPERWQPQPLEEATNEGIEKGGALQRAIVQLVYDFPREGIVFVQLVGKALPGPRGEEESGVVPGECSPGDGTACYTGGFALDIPGLIPDGPKDLELTGPVRLSISGTAATLRMDEFPPVVMYLRSQEISQLPSGVTATLIISGAPGEVAEGTFDGSRLELSNVAFRIRVVLGEVPVDQVTVGMAAIVDIVIEKLTLKTIEPYDHGEIALHLETTLSSHPTGNELFDQFLGGADVIVVMRGELAL